MKLVKEHINFERGIDPKASMNIGYWKLLQEEIDKMLWKESNDVELEIYGRTYCDGNNEVQTDVTLYILNFLIKYVETKGDIKKALNNSEYKKLRSDLWEVFAYGLKKHYNIDVYYYMNITKESNFQRGIKPKHAMNIGAITQIKKDHEYFGLIPLLELNNIIFGKDIANDPTGDTGYIFWRFLDQVDHRNLTNIKTAAINAFNHYSITLETKKIIAEEVQKRYGINIFPYIEKNN
jgi:hypothetical protein